MTDFNENFSSKPILTVTELNRLARDVLEMSFPLFWVSGEISNLTRASSGHWYFSLKDTSAQVRCIMFKNRNNYVNWIPKEGDKIEAHASVTLYEARGEFQLTVESINKSGLGVVYEAFERLKNKLDLEGLFDKSAKRAIPKYPKQIGVITSLGADALGDVLTTLKRRMPSIPVIIYPTLVQGKEAALQITAAINTANQRAECDVLIICRGGGSMEDLWQFNEEKVARAIFNCKIVTISGVGHETNFTIADFVADARAATPTAAAELASPDRQSTLYELNQLHLHLTKKINSKLNQHMQSLDYLSKRLLSPLQQLQQKIQQINQLQQRLALSITNQLNRHQQALLRLNDSLKQLNPDAVLVRGYAFVQNSHGNLVISSNQLKQQEQVSITFAQGKAEAKIIATHLPEIQTRLF